jgi:hypothetical protein
MSASITFAGRVSGIGHFDQYSRYRRFVLTKTSQLPERPTSQSCPMLMPNLYPVENAAQVLKSNTSSGAFGRSNDLIRNAMIHVARKTRFFARQFTKATACRLRLDLLKFSPQPALPVAHGLDRLAAIVLPVRVAGNICNPEIDSEEIISVFGRRLFDIAGSRQEPFAAMEQKIGLSLSGCELPQLPISSRESDLDAARQGSNGDSLLIDVPRQVSVIKSEATERLKLALRFLIQFVGIGHLRGAPYGYLCWDSKGVPQFTIRKFLERVLGKRLLFPRLIAQPIARLVRRAQEFIERLSLRGIGEQFNFCGELQ